MSDSTAKRINIQFTKKQIVDTVEIEGEEYNKIIVPKNSDYPGYTFIIRKGWCHQSKFDDAKEFFSLGENNYVIISKSEATDLKGSEGETVYKTVKVEVEASKLKELMSLKIKEKLNDAKEKVNEHNKDLDAKENKTNDIDR